jgi:predicted 3-demethylubiquinone-9 3-methyltransferase (glyoxalase superfamily)
MNITNTITPCLWCNDNAEEKAKYYCSVFPNSKIISEHRFMYVMELNGNRFQVLNGGVDFEYNNSVSFTIPCKDQEEVDHYWNTFINDGGSELECSWCIDKYGVRWQIVPTILSEGIMHPDKEVASRVMAAMLKMRKIIVADIEAAFVI